MDALATMAVGAITEPAQINTIIAGRAWQKPYPPGFQQARREAARDRERMLDLQRKAKPKRHVEGAYLKARCAFGQVSRYKHLMSDGSRLSPTEVAEARERRLGATRLQEIEGNPLSADQVAMFEMFEREAWPHEPRRAYILARATTLAAE